MKYHLRGKDQVVRGGLLESLRQLTTLTWDGDLISKSDRNELVKKGYAIKCEGFNVISKKGIKVMEELKLIHP